MSRDRAPSWSHWPAHLPGSHYIRCSCFLQTHCCHEAWPGAGALGQQWGAVSYIGGGSAPSPVCRGAGPLSGTAVRLEPGDVGAEGPCLAPAMEDRDEVVGAEPLHSGKGPTGRQQGGGSGHGRDAGE